MGFIGFFQPYFNGVVDPYFQLVGAHFAGDFVSRESKAEPSKIPEDVQLMLRQQEQRRVGDVAQMEMRWDTQNEPDFRFHWRVETCRFFTSIAEYVSGRSFFPTFSVWIASKVDVFSPFLAFLALDERCVFMT